jgi:hypothetical protein
LFHIIVKNGLVSSQIGTPARSNSGFDLETADNREPRASPGKAFEFKLTMKRSTRLERGARGGSRAFPVRNHRQRMAGKIAVRQCFMTVR